MREIKFKANRVDNGEWVQGYYVKTPTNQHRIYWQPFEEATANTYHIVDPDTICQYTGLKDRYGNEIFEGDRVEFRANYTNKPTGYHSGIISYTPYRMLIAADNGCDYDAEEETDEFPYLHCKVSGNIHD